MIIYLFRDHTAAAVDDRSGRIRTVPQTDGVLSIGNISTPVTEDGQAVCHPIQAAGEVHGSFVSSAGIRYTLQKLRVNREGVPVSCMEERSFMLAERVRLDALETLIEELRKTVQDLRGIYEKDALWFTREEHKPYEEEETK